MPVLRGPAADRRGPERILRHDQRILPPGQDSTAPRSMRFQERAGKPAERWCPSQGRRWRKNRLFGAAGHDTSRRSFRSGERGDGVLHERAGVHGRAGQPNCRLGADQHDFAGQHRRGALQTVMDSEIYGMPPAMQQKPGPPPLADLLKEKDNPFRRGHQRASGTDRRQR